MATSQEHRTINALFRIKFCKIKSGRNRAGSSGGRFYFGLYNLNIKYSCLYYVLNEDCQCNHRKMGKLHMNYDYITTDRDLIGPPNKPLQIKQTTIKTGNQGL